MTSNIVADEQLGILARRQNDLFRRVRDGTLPVERVLASLQDLIEGDFDAVPAGPRRLIDCDASPFIPDGWTVEEHRKGGQLEFDPAKIALYLDEVQKGRVVGNELRKKLQGKSVLNACVLDFLLANTNLIPDSWKQDGNGETRYIYFWGTIYRGVDGSLFVRFLCWSDGRWRWDLSHLVSGWNVLCPAAVLAS